MSLRAMGISVLFFAFLAVSLAQQDLNGKVFLFPEQSDSSYVILKPELKNTLNKLTVCLQYYTSLARDYALFSLATRGADNAFLIYPTPPNLCYVYVNQEDFLFTIDVQALDWTHICASWDSGTGEVQLWVNGKLYPRRLCRNKGFVLQSETSIILGQDQDTFGGKFSDAQSFVGEISNVNMWDYVLSADNMRKTVFDRSVSGTVIGWRSLQYETKGKVSVLPQLQCKFWDKTYISYAQCSDSNTNK
ncbi:C-reactive protein-like [Pseudophryne corroboree]|uniref:C-reactive protein-like n=1 Tax=Pseudophryne corroboree TaxID=495146 RepID=UPI0030812CEE